MTNAEAKHMTNVNVVLRMLKHMTNTNVMLTLDIDLLEVRAANNMDGLMQYMLWRQLLIGYVLYVEIRCVVQRCEMDAVPYDGGAHRISAAL
jgi:hypothetical protein